MTSLTKTAVDLLLQAMETRAGKVQVATLRQVAARVADMLLEARLLVATGHIPVVATMDGYEDEPIPAEWCPERGQYGYRDSVGRWITVEAGEIAACTVDYPLAFARMLVAFERAGPSRPSPLIDGLVWDVGTIRLTGAKSPVPVWFARRLADPAVWTRLDALLERRSPEGQRQQGRDDRGGAGPGLVRAPEFRERDRPLLTFLAHIRPEGMRDQLVVEAAGMEREASGAVDVDELRRLEHLAVLGDEMKRAQRFLALTSLGLFAHCAIPFLTLRSRLRSGKN